MGTLLEKLTHILGQHLDEFRSALEGAPETRRITGFVVSSSFVGLSHQDRQDLLWRTIDDARMTEEECDLIGPIVTMTPDEASLKVGDGSN